MFTETREGPIGDCLTMVVDVKNETLIYSSDTMYARVPLNLDGDQFNGIHIRYPTVIVDSWYLVPTQLRNRILSLCTTPGAKLYVMDCANDEIWKTFEKG